MKNFAILSMVGALLIGATVVNAEEVKSGLQPGKAIGAFYVTKCAGAEEDGIAEGQNLCYHCKNGSRPQVMVFTRSSDEKVVNLVKSLDKALAENSDKQLRAFVNLLGEDKESLTADAKKMAQATSAKNVPFVVPNEFENGPDDYGINQKASVTIIVANGGKVTANHAVSTTDELEIEKVLADVKKSVN